MCCQVGQCNPGVLGASPVPLLFSPPRDKCCRGALGLSAGLHRLSGTEPQRQQLCSTWSTTCVGKIGAFCRCHLHRVICVRDKMCLLLLSPSPTRSSFWKALSLLALWRHPAALPRGAELPGTRWVHGMPSPAAGGHWTAAFLQIRKSFGVFLRYVTCQSQCYCQGFCTVRPKCQVPSLLFPPVCISSPSPTQSPLLSVFLLSIAKHCSPLADLVGRISPWPLTLVCLQPFALHRTAAVLCKSWTSFPPHFYLKRAAKLLRLRETGDTL